jgi:hypothetical protein
MQHKIKVKFFFIQLLSIIPFLIFIFYLFDIWFDTRRQLVLELNLNNTSNKSEIIYDSIKQLESTSLYLSESALEANIISSQLKKNGAQINQTLSQIRERFDDIYSLSIFDKNGNLLASDSILTNSEKEKLAALVKQDSNFTKVLNSKIQVRSNCIDCPINDKKMIAVYTPILSNGNVVYILKSALDIEYLKNSMENQNLALNNTNIPVLVFDSDNKLLFQTGKKYDPQAQKEDFSDEEYIKNASAHKPNYIENAKLPFFSGKYTGVSLKVRDYNWTLVSVQPATEVYSVLFKVQNAVWMILIFALFFSVSLISYFLRKVRIVF